MSALYLSKQNRLIKEEESEKHIPSSGLDLVRGGIRDFLVQMLHYCKTQIIILQKKNKKRLYQER